MKGSPQYINDPQIYKNEVIDFPHIASTHCKEMPLTDLSDYFLSKTNAYVVRYLNRDKV